MARSYHLNPALKRRAIVDCSFGTKTWRFWCSIAVRELWFLRRGANEIRSGAPITQDTTLLDKPASPRPEELKFPPLNYQPPAPEQFRVQLKSGPIAYVVPDRELPLVNIIVYVHTGDYLEPGGKEGLANLTGYLLARGGAGTNSADQLEERLAFPGGAI